MFAASTHPATVLAFLSTILAIASAGLGVSAVVGAPRRIVPFGGGLLMGIAVFGVLPELGEAFGWAGGLAALACGVAALWLIGRFVYPVCPSCSHTHDHEHCATSLHGFALPLLSAAAVHAFLDGLGIAASQQERAGGLGTAVFIGVMLHKVPEGVALGSVLRAALQSRRSAFAWACAAEAATVFGAALESAVTTRLGVVWVNYALALAGGSFVYLGFHAVHGEWKRRGVPAFMPALTGAVGAAALQHGLRVLLH